jgi:hypothetical protein
MPGPLLHVGATVMCAHGGQAQPTPHSAGPLCHSRLSIQRLGISRALCHGAMGVGCNSCTVERSTSVAI